MPRSEEEKALKREQRRRKKFSRKVEGPGKEKLIAGYAGPYAAGKQDQGSAKEAAKREAEKKRGRSKSQVYSIREVPSEKRSQTKTEVHRPGQEPGITVVQVGKKKRGESKTLLDTTKGTKAPSSVNGIDLTEQIKGSKRDAVDADVLKTRTRSAAVSKAAKEGLRAYGRETGGTDDKPDVLVKVKRKSVKGKKGKVKTSVKTFGPKGINKKKTVTGLGTVDDPRITTKTKGKTVTTKETYKIPKEEAKKKKKTITLEKSRRQQEKKKKDSMSPSAYRQWKKSRR